MIILTYEANFRTICTSFDENFVVSPNTTSSDKSATCTVNTSGTYYVKTYCIGRGTEPTGTSISLNDNKLVSNTPTDCNIEDEIEFDIGDVLKLTLGSNNNSGYTFVGVICEK